jgi:hypothetical protein
MKFRIGTWGHLAYLTASLIFLGAWQVRANNIEVDWTFNGFSTDQIDINPGDEVDIYNYDDTFDLQVTGAPPEGFYADVPATDGVNIYYVAYVYNNPGTFSFSDELGNSVTVIVGTITAPLSLTISSPADNTMFTPPATFAIAAVPNGGTPPYEVEFFVGTNSAGVSYSSPFTATVTGLPIGNYQLSAVVTDDNFDTATSSIAIEVAQPQMTNNVLPVACADIYSSGSVVSGYYLAADPDPHGGLEFAAFNANPYSAILLELNPYALPLSSLDLSVYGFDGGTGTLTGSNFNSGSLIGVWALPASLSYGQAATFDVTAFVKSAKGPYFGFILVSQGGDMFSSTTINYGIPPELYAVAPLGPPWLATTRSGNQIVISWPTNNAAGLSLQATTTLGAGAAWTTVSSQPSLVGTQWVVTNSLAGAGQYFRLSSQ